MKYQITLEFSDTDGDSISEFTNALVRDLQDTCGYGVKDIHQEVIDA